MDSSKQSSRRSANGTTSLPRGERKPSAKVSKGHAGPPAPAPNKSATKAAGKAVTKPTSRTGAGKASAATSRGGATAARPPKAVEPVAARRGPLSGVQSVLGVHSVLGGPLQYDAESADGDGGNAPTQRQMDIYSFIRDKIHSRGFGPTVREIGQAFRIRSPNGVVCHLKALERKRLITRGRNMSRAIELMAEPAHLKGLPMAGWVAAGSLRVADEQRERIDFQELFDRDDHFVLKVMGDSMIEAQISDGDWVVIRRQKTARAGDIVVAQTDDGEATLKQWFPERDRIRLQPANASMKPMFVKNARVLGVLVGVVRKTG